MRIGGSLNTLTGEMNCSAVRDVAMRQEAVTQIRICSF